MTGVAAGWYPGPDGAVRWWDGTEWTDDVLDHPAPEDTAPRLDPVAVTAPAPEPAVRRRPPLLVPLLAAVVVTLVAGLAIAAVLIGRSDPKGPTAARVAASTTVSSDAAPPEPSQTPTEAPGETSSETPTPTPDAGPEVDAVADAFITAIIAIDCPTIERLSTPAYLTNQGSCDEDLPADALAGAVYTRDPAAVAGASATVMAVITREGPDERPGPAFRFTLTLVNTARGWRVNDLATAS